MTIALAARVLNDGDAIGNDLLGMADALRTDGRAVVLFAEKARVDRDVRPLTELDAFLQSSATRLILHLSNDCEPGVRAAEKHADRSIVKFHNTTPARFFGDYDAGLVRETIRGRRQAVRLAKLGVRFWVDSDFNGRDLAADAPGLRRETLAPFHQAESLARAVPDTDRLAGLDDWATTLLCVGRVAPNKNLELALDVLARLRDREPRARLIVAGEHLFPDYSAKLLERAIRLGVEDEFEVTGRVTAAQLKALYQSADALLATSEHEGFCVPLVEAMALGVPIAALPRTAVPETAGDAALYADDADGLADAARQLVADGPLRERRIRHGFARYRECFSTAALTDRFRTLLDRALTSSSVA
jgi:glycosyltransferase involved in cell wall biosynthesis